jgi:hypothetical protein
VSGDQLKKQALQNRKSPKGSEVKLHPLQCHLQVSDAESVQCLHFHHRPVPVNLCPLLVCKFLGPGTFLHSWASYSGILAPTNECLHELHFQLGHGLKDWSMQALASFKTKGFHGTVFLCLVLRGFLH